MKGELFKLYNYYNAANGDGLLGVLITVLLYTGLTLLNTFLYYNYLVFVHVEGRLIDVYTRITADLSHFFIPYDNEVSARYLRWVIYKIQRENASQPDMEVGMKHAAVTYHTVENSRAGFHNSTTHIATYRRRSSGLKRSRRGRSDGLVSALCPDRRRRHLRARRMRPLLR